ncbi:unnamed protein product [Oikopleura dioica]|uniref:Uncharacterized protein n=1 Tax=Oikopleura dioica TaxID=34765 RepID=E4YHC1_OIKDI|nr:unnamed protein product [Oikopleura dioica]
MSYSDFPSFHLAFFEYLKITALHHCPLLPFNFNATVVRIYY